MLTSSFRARAAAIALLTLVGAAGSFGCRVPAPPTDASVPMRARLEASASELAEEPADASSGSAASADTDELAEGWTADEARRLAALRNPGLEALWHEWKAAAEKAPQALALPEPRFTYVEYVESVQTRTGPQERSFGLVVPLPWLEKPLLRADIEEAAAAAAWQRFLAGQIALDREVRFVVADYWLLARSIEITRESLEILARVERVARQKLAAGASNHPDVIRLQLEIGRLEDRLASLVDRRRALAAHINALLARPAAAEVPWPGDLPGPAPLPPEEEILGMAAERNPELAALAHEIEKADVARELASRMYFPDLAVGFQTIATGSAVIPNQRDSGVDPWMVSVAIDVPIWWSKYRAAEREAEARQEAARQRRADRERTLVADLELALFELRDAKRRVTLHEDTLIPKAEESLTASEAAYSVGAADFLDLLDSERALLDLRLGAQRARADLARADARIDRLLGRYPIFDEVPEADRKEVAR